MLIRLHAFALLFVCSVWSTPAASEEVKVAIAANFLGTFNEIADAFQRDAGHTVVVSPGSSGKLYAQITNGAPFDVFFSADVRRPELLEQEGIAVQGSRFTYAVGRLTLWSPDPGRVTSDAKAVLTSGAYNHLAIANPDTAPYGLAAKQTLEKLGLWEHLQGKLVRGENIGQAFQFVHSRSAELGFVALSQVLDPKNGGQGSRWNVPPELYAPLEQQAVLLDNGKDNPAAKALLDFVKGPAARSIIKRYGYRVP